MPYSGSWLRAATLAGWTALGAAPALAADMLKFPVESAPEFAIQSVELGSGWYLRGGLSGSNNKGPLLVPDAPVGRKLDWALDVGAGYKFNNWLRSDATLTFNKPQDISRNGFTVTCPYGLTSLLDADQKLIGYLWDTGPNARETCNPRNKSELKKTDLMLNAYVDLGSWSGLTPFVGVGAGVSMLQTSAAQTFFKTSDGSVYAADLTAGSTAYVYPWVDRAGRPIGTPYTPWIDSAGRKREGFPPVFFEKQNWNRNASKTSYNLAWSLMGGVAYDVTPQLKAEFGYRYLNSGSFTSLSSPFTGAAKSKIDSHQMQLGFRYQID